MIDPELVARLDEIQALAEKAYHAAESTRKYLFWTDVVTVVLIVLPLIGLAFAVPQFINSYTSTLTGAGL
jgi:type IV secretory pathway component VirB8